MNDATSWLFGLQRFGMEPGLERIHALLHALGRPDRRYRSVLIGGTNGKGTTTGALAAMLTAAGERTGAFTSPHLVDPGERIAVDGRPTSPAAFEDLAARIRPHAREHGATFFEAVTAMACLAFAEAACTTVVFEVGLGGRLDATNVLDPVASVITDVDLDHTEVLGDTVSAIASEKAGILRPDRPAWTAATGEAAARLDAHAARSGARLRRLGRDARATTSSLGWDGLLVRIDHDGERHSLRSPLMGSHQGRNLALAALTGRALGVSDAAVRAGAATFRAPGRLEPLSAAPAGSPVRVLLDGAHNPAAANALAGALAEASLRPHLVLGVSAEKDVLGIARALAPAVASIRVTRAASSPRALPPAVLAQRLREIGTRPAGAFDDAWQALVAAARAASDDDAPVLVAGSLFLVGEVRARLVGERPHPFERRQ